MALIWYLLPHVIAKQRSLPFVARVAPEMEIHCHALAVARKHELTYDTVVLSGGNRRAEHLKLAHVTGSKWVVHPGTALSTSFLFLTDVPDECSQNKRHKSKAVVVDKIEPIKNEEALSKLFAVAHHIGSKLFI